MVLKNALYIAHVAHQRVRPKTNGFCYKIFYLSFPLRLWSDLGRTLLFSLERFNLFSLKSCDYGKGNPEAWIRAQLAAWNITQANGDIVLVTLPRVLGYAFNPVSFWFCLDSAGAVRAVLADVSNTFGEHHAYLLFHDDQHPISSREWVTAVKSFHVSPFIEVGGHYEFRFAYSDKKIGIWINHHDRDGLLLTTSMVGRRQDLTSRALLFCFFRYPLITFKVIAMIHYQALRLALKGIRYRVKPAPPTMEISR